MNKKINCSRFALPLVTSMLVTTSMNASAATLISGSISTDGFGGLTGDRGYATGTTLSWIITQDMQSNLWTYDYTLDVTGKDISHIILGLCTDDIKLSDLTISGDDHDLPYAVTTWDDAGPGNSNPGLPGDLYGLKINTDDDTKALNFVIETSYAPGPGDFYAKGGQEFLYNTGFGDAAGGHALVPCFDLPPEIPPEIPNAIPEPSATLALAFLLMTGLSTRRRN